MVDTALRELSPEFAGCTLRRAPLDPAREAAARPASPVLYSVRSERQLMEQLDYNLLFRWFVGLSMDDPVWDPTVFTKNRERLLRGDIAAQPSSSGSWPRRRAASCCPPSTSRSTAP